MTESTTVKSGQEIEQKQMLLANSGARNVKSEAVAQNKPPPLTKSKTVIEALASMSLVQLGSEWERISQKPAPDIGADLLSRNIAYRMQERQYGGLTTTARRQINRLANQLGNGAEVSISPHGELKPGTHLSRDWHGKTCHVLVMDGGFLFEDRRYGSLSQIANAITGTKWSGPRFFGLADRKGAGPKSKQGDADV